MRRSGPAGVRHVEPDAPKPRRLRDGRYTLVNLFIMTYCHPAEVATRKDRVRIGVGGGGRRAVRGERDAQNDLQGHTALAAVWERAGCREKRLYRTRRASTTTTINRLRKLEAGHAPHTVFTVDHEPPGS